jgi:uncharacterized protein (TIGR04168 family)
MLPDLEGALNLVRAAGRTVALVTFGHMHRMLQQKKNRRMIVNQPRHRTVYLNTAVVPRVERVEAVHDSQHESADSRNFTLVELEGLEVQSVQELWVSVNPQREQACVVSRAEMLHEATCM